MKTEQIKLSQVKVNGENPRTITNDKFAKLVNSILVFPKMLNIRPVVVDNKMVALGGNMRLQALKRIASMTTDEIINALSHSADFVRKSEGERQATLAHWEEWLKKPVIEVIKASELTEEEKKQFVIKDNVSFGNWDWDKLANSWDNSSLGDWGMDVWQTHPTEFAPASAPTAPATPQYTPSEPAPSEIDGVQHEPYSLPTELQGLDLTPTELPKIQGDDQTAKERIIIVFSKEHTELLANLLGMPQIDKVLYRLEEIMPELNEEVR